MPRRYRRYHKTTKLVKPVKYSNETFSAYNITQWADGTQYTSTIIPGSDVLGTRKVKNFTLTFALECNPETPADQLVPVLWALVFVPEGTDPTNLNSGNTINNQKLTSVSLYEPNQNVIMQGVIDAKQIYRFKTRLGRNLNAGDTIQLIWKPLGGFAANSMICFTINYALAF